MPRTKEQFEGIRKNKIALIKQSAMELFASEGYLSTSIAKIAQSANISKGLMYNYFKSKEDLLQSIVRDGVNETFEAFDRNKDGRLTTDEFEYYVRQNFILIKEKREFYKLLYTIMLQPNVHEIITSVQNDISTKVLTIANEYFEQNFEDPQTELILFSSLMKGLSMQYVFAPEYISDEMIEKAVQRILEFYKR